MSTPGELLCSRAWRLRHGAWMLWGILSFGLLWGVGFAIIGIRARNKTWLAIAGVGFAFLVGYVVFTSGADMPAKGEPSTSESSASGGVLVLTWILGGVIAWLVNRRYLVWLAHNGRRGPWYASAGAAPAVPRGTSGLAGGNSARVVDDAARLPGLPPKPSGSSWVNSSFPNDGHSQSTAPPALSSADVPPPVDLNTADRMQLATLPGLDLAWADHIIATRRRSGGFSSPTDLVTSAGLQPHVFAGIRERVFTSADRPRQTPTPADGRRLEF